MELVAGSINGLLYKLQCWKTCWQDNHAMFARCHGWPARFGASLTARLLLRLEILLVHRMPRYWTNAQLAMHFSKLCMPSRHAFRMQRTCSTAHISLAPWNKITGTTSSAYLFSATFLRWLYWCPRFQQWDPIAREELTIDASMASASAVPDLNMAEIKDMWVACKSLIRARLPRCQSATSPAVRGEFQRSTAVS